MRSSLLEEQKSCDSFACWRIGSDKISSPVDPGEGRQVAARVVAVECDFDCIGCLNCQNDDFHANVAFQKQLQDTLSHTNRELNSLQKQIEACKRSIEELELKHQDFDDTRPGIRLEIARTRVHIQHHCAHRWDYQFLNLGCETTSDPQGPVCWFDSWQRKCICCRLVEPIHERQYLAGFQETRGKRAREREIETLRLEQQLVGEPAETKRLRTDESPFADPGV